MPADLCSLYPLMLKSRLFEEATAKRPRPARPPPALPWRRKLTVPARWRSPFLASAP